MSTEGTVPGQPIIVPSPQGGIALIIVLWMLALLAVIANSLVFSLRSEIRVASNLAASARVEAMADAGVFRAIQELSRPVTDVQRWQGNGLPHAWKFGDASMRITILDEAARIDLNSTPALLLKGLLLSAGTDEQTADSLVDAILDWRDPDDFSRLHGAEKDAYWAAGKDYLPRNSNFETIDELRLVLGVDASLFERIAPSITVYSGRSGVDSSIAPRSVLLALPGATPALVDSHVSQRQALQSQGLSVPDAPFGQAMSSRQLGDTFTIQVLATLGDNAGFFREAVVRMTPGQREPYVILAWRAPQNRQVQQ